METAELKKQLIEMIECIDDEELLYTLREDVVFHVTTKAVITEQDSTSNFTKDNNGSFGLYPM